MSKKGGYVQNRKVFKLSVRVEGDELRTALAEAAEYSGDDIGKRNDAIQNLLDTEMRFQVDEILRLYRARAAERAEAQRRAALEAERQEIHELLAKSEEAKRRLQELDGVLADDFSPPKSHATLRDLEASDVAADELGGALEPGDSMETY